MSRNAEAPDQALKGAPSGALEAPPPLRARRRPPAREGESEAEVLVGAAPSEGMPEPPIGDDCRGAHAAGVAAAGAAGLALPLADLLLDGAATRDERIIGSGDRMHHLALVPGQAPPAPPRSRLESDALVLPPGPRSRAECRRRCGKAGFCDPSSALGCGGEYCGNASAAARYAL